MGKLPFTKSLWPWPSCQQEPRTLSFRNEAAAATMFKTMNSVYNSTESRLTNSSESASFSTSSECGGRQRDESIERMVNTGLRSERLFFEPGQRETRSILEDQGGSSGSSTKATCFRGSVVLSMESEEPYAEFRKSMEEMVEAHGLRDWDGLEELLCWYLNANRKSNHRYIIGAFVDFLIANLANNNQINSSSSSSSSSNSQLDCSCSYEVSSSSPLSFYTSSSSSYSLTSSSKEAAVQEIES